MCLVNCIAQESQQDRSMPLALGRQTGGAGGWGTGCGVFGSPEVWAACGTFLLWLLGTDQLRSWEVTVLPSLPLCYIPHSKA